MRAPETGVAPVAAVDVAFGSVLALALSLAFLLVLALLHATTAKIATAAIWCCGLCFVNDFIGSIYFGIR
jgi:hypothetical protein